MARERIRHHTFRANVFSTVGEQVEKNSTWVLEQDGNDFFVTAEGGQKNLTEASMKIISVIFYEGVFPPSSKVVDLAHKRNCYYVEHDGNFLFVHIKRR